MSLINPAVSPDPDKIDPCFCLYQVGFESKPVEGEILEYPQIEAVTRDKEEEELRVLYRRIRTFAVGHGCAAEWKDEYARTTDAVRTQFLPFYEVAAVGTGDVGEQPARRISRLADSSIPTETLAAELRLFLNEYNDWIARLLEENDDIPASYEEPVARILDRVRAAADRMEAGIKLLEEDDDVLTAFRWANLATAIQMRRGQPDLAGTRRVRDTLGQPSRSTISTTTTHGARSSSPSNC